jgi:cyclophilin family peptidyl-prolyl cis-trans isomerase
VLTVLIVLLTLGVAPASGAEDRTIVVRVETPLGSFEVELFPDLAPITVANFLKYVSAGDYENSFFHRSVPGFVIQGGGYAFENGEPVAIATRAAIINEFGRSNLRGTLAMAKQAGDPNSATNQWFINLVNNAAALDGQNGGFTVFGQILGDGMAVVDALVAVPIFSAGGPFTELPLRDYTVGNPIAEENLLFTRIAALSVPAAPVLLRRSTNRSWYSYRLSVDDAKVTIEERGAVKLTRSAAFGTVSRRDFDGDGEPDVLLRSSTTAMGSNWILATLVGKKIISVGEIALATGDDWSLISTDDFDRDTKADALFRNDGDGSWMLYLLDGLTVRGSRLLDLSDDLADTIVGTADFNGDGRSDVLLRRANGTWLIYLLNGVGTPKRGRPKLPKSARSSVAAIADFDGDGTADVMMRNDSGRWDFFGLDGIKVRTKGIVRMSRDTDSVLASHADFNGDGKADALLRNADGTWHLYTLDGRKILHDGAVEMTDDAGYSIVSTADFNSDGNADVLLRHSDGTWLLYTLDGSGPTILSTTVPKLSTSKTWVPQID